MKFQKRFELITEKGRQFVLHDVDCQISVQDNGETLKVFVYSTHNSSYTKVDK